MTKLNQICSNSLGFRKKLHTTLGFILIHVENINANFQPIFLVNEPEKKIKLCATELDTDTLSSIVRPMAIRVVEFSSRGYKIRKIFA